MKPKVYHGIEKNFFKIPSQIIIIFKLIAIIVEIHFILHVRNGSNIIIQVKLHEFI